MCVNAYKADSIPVAVPFSDNSSRLLRVPCAEEQFIEPGELPATEVPELLPVQPLHSWS